MFPRVQQYRNKIIRPCSVLIPVALKLWPNGERLVTKHYQTQDCLVFKNVDVRSPGQAVIKHDQTRWPNGKMFGSLTMFDVVMFGRRTFPVLTGPKPASRSANLYLNPVYRHLKNAERRPSFC